MINIEKEQEGRKITVFGKFFLFTASHFLLILSVVFFTAVFN